MENKRYTITLTQQLFESLKRSKDKSILLAGDLQISSGDWLRVTECIGKSSVTTGRYEDFTVTGITPMPSSAFKDLALLKLRKHFQYQ